jgi:hypothetical protein
VHHAHRDRQSGVALAFIAGGSPYPDDSFNGNAKRQAHPNIISTFLSGFHGNPIPNNAQISFAICNSWRLFSNGVFGGPCADSCSITARFS